MDLLIGFAIALAVGLLAAVIMKARFKGTVFAKISSNVGFGLFVMISSFYLFAVSGLTVWSLSLIPVISLLILLLVVRNAIHKLLEIKK